MNEYELGTAVVLDFTWETDSDDDGQVDDPTDPTTVFFRVEKPDGTVLTFTFGTDPEVDNPSVGRYTCALDATILDQPGQYPYVATGTGEAEAVFEGFFTVTSNEIDSPVAAPVLQGVCGLWADPASIVSCCQGASWPILEQYVGAASEALFFATGSRYAGSCSMTVRPCDDRCSCGRQILDRGFVIESVRWLPGSCFERSCCDVSTVRLAGGVRRIVEVKIDGDVLDPSEYRVDQGEYLVRLADVDGNPQFWPGCQRRDLDDTEVGTFSVEYEYGYDPPVGGALAAAQLACEMYAACAQTDGECVLPSGVTQVTRQGVTIDLGLIAEFVKMGKTGIVAVDVFMAPFVAQPPAGALVWSPDVPGYAQPVG